MLARPTSETATRPTTQLAYISAQPTTTQPPIPATPTTTQRLTLHVNGHGGGAGAADAVGGLAGVGSGLGEGGGVGEEDAVLVGQEIGSQVPFVTTGRLALRRALDVEGGALRETLVLARREQRNGLARTVCDDTVCHLCKFVMEGNGEREKK